MEYEIVNCKGKKRTVTKMNTIDRFVSRLLAQKLNEFYNPLFLRDSCAYQHNKGIQTAVERARVYIEAGMEYVVEIDIKNFFDEISLEILESLLKEEIKDQKVLKLLNSFLYCSISYDGNVKKKKKGLLQGSSISPVLSNLYLNDLDYYMEDKEYYWVRFADDIRIYTKSKEEGIKIYTEICQYISEYRKLPISKQKSGVYCAYERRFLGYDFKKEGKQIVLQKHEYQRKERYKYWHPSALEKVNQEYHILQGGILNKKDYAILFENNEEKHYIPVEGTVQINVYNEIMLTSTVLSVMYKEMIRLALFDKYGNAIGYFIPESYCQDGKIVVNQVREYQNTKLRLKMAKKLETAAIHNIRANVRYYNKRKNKNLEELISSLNQGIADVQTCKTVNELLLVEGRCRQLYYQGFNTILNDDTFTFTGRSRRPPRDEINALLSFGNTILYNRMQQVIWKTQLDARIGIFHAANRRHFSLNLDFADLFKPIIIDRIIFSLINRHQITKDLFERHTNGAVYLNNHAKKIFLESFDEKMNSKRSVKGKIYTYNQLIEHEIRQYQKHVMEGVEYRPYKYY